LTNNISPVIQTGGSPIAEHSPALPLSSFRLYIKSVWALAWTQILHVYKQRQRL